MRNTFIFSVLTILLLSSFNSEKSLNNISQSYDKILTLDNQKWYLTTIYKADGYTQVLIRKAFISFTIPDGKIGGNGSCNSFGGSVIVSNDSLTLTNIFSTKMYCDSVQSIEDDLFSQLKHVTRYKIQGNKLLLYRGEELLLEFDAG